MGAKASIGQCFYWVTGKKIMLYTMNITIEVVKTINLPEMPEKARLDILEKLAESGGWASEDIVMMSCTDEDGVVIMDL